MKTKLDRELAQISGEINNDFRDLHQRAQTLLGATVEVGAAVVDWGHAFVGIFRGRSSQVERQTILKRRD